jgi:3-deoxy-manno-octulosonate cytidylyltransferase (CMP-KDO synthetase)
MKIGIVPARLNSTRLPKKILMDLCDKPMIAHVMEKAMQSKKLDKVILAVDSKETIEKLSGYDYEIVMTSEDHNSGTDRVEEVANKFPEAKIVINIQGDEPLLDSKMIDDLVCLMEEPDVEMATILSKKLTVSDLLNPNVVKAIMDEDHNAVEFKRNVFDLEIGGVYRHIGMYGFKRNTLSKFTSLEISKRESERKLEQMRALDNDIQIRAMITSYETLSIDTQEDFKKVENILKNIKSDNLGNK